MREAKDPTEVHLALVGGASVNEDFANVIGAELSSRGGVGGDRKKSLRCDITTSPTEAMLPQTISSTLILDRFGNPCIRFFTCSELALARSAFPKFFNRFSGLEE